MRKKRQIIPLQSDRSKYDLTPIKHLGNRQLPEAAYSRINFPPKTVECPHCNKINRAWGTRKYCKNNICQRAEKRKRETFVNSLVKTIRKGLYANYKLFREHLPTSGRVEINYDQALKKGFDEHAYYGTNITKENERWYKVEEYYFAIMHKLNERLLIIYKK